MQQEDLFIPFFWHHLFDDVRSPLTFRHICFPQPEPLLQPIISEKAANDPAGNPICGTLQRSAIVAIVRRCCRVQRIFFPFLVNYRILSVSNSYGPDQSQNLYLIWRELRLCEFPRDWGPQRRSHLFAYELPNCGELKKFKKSLNFSQRIQSKVLRSNNK